MHRLHDLDKIRRVQQLLAYLFISLPAYGADHGELYINSFLTLGVAVTDADETYYDGIDKVPKLDGRDTKIGLNIFGALDDFWQASAQFTARNIVDNYALHADWAFLQYQPSEEWELRVGRQMFPMWIMSEFIDVGRAYPWVRPPEEVYDVFPIKSMSGITFAWNSADKFEAMQLSAQAFAGGVIEKRYGDFASTFTSDRLFGGALGLERGDIQLRTAYLQGTFYAPELRISETNSNLISASFEFDNGSQLLLIEGASVSDTTDESTREKRYNEALAELAAAQQAGDGNAVKSAEYAVFSNSMKAVDGSAGFVTGGWYLKNALLHLTYARVFEQDASLLGEKQTSLTLGCRYSFNPKTDLKLEAKHIILPDDDGENGLYFVTDRNVKVKRESNVYSLAFNVNF